MLLVFSMLAHNVGYVHTGLNVMQNQRTLLSVHAAYIRGPYITQIRSSGRISLIQTTTQGAQSLVGGIPVGSRYAERHSFLDTGAQADDLIIQVSSSIHICSTCFNFLHDRASNRADINHYITR